MEVYTYSEARQNLATLLDQAESSGKVIIRRKDGRSYALIPETLSTSPLDVPSIQSTLSSQEIVEIIREGRERSPR
jgi:PHD/YefM family antitoxin component YafN of YafNO toxin-antitoxin module